MGLMTLEGSWGRTLDPWVSAAAVIAGVLVLALGALMLRRRRTGPSADRAPVPPGDTQVSGSAAVAAEQDKTLPAEQVGGPSTELRALRAHVRALELALEQENDRAAELRSLMQTQREQAVGETMQQVRASIRGLARRMDGDQGAVEILNRVSAALDRLSAGDSFARPVLARAGDWDQTSSWFPGQALIQQRARHQMKGPQGAAPVERSVAVAGSDASSPVADQPAFGSPERDVVLPVPPREEEEAVHRGRRWFRRAAA